MSIDLYLQIDTGRADGKLSLVEDIGNYTHNCQPMWNRAFETSAFKHPELAASVIDDGHSWLCRLTGKKAGDILELIKDAIADMDNPLNESAYLALNPANGWGEFTSARDYLRRFYTACAQNPLCTIYASC